jgi:uncharacterized membrane protein (DUF2068 family)
MSAPQPNTPDPTDSDVAFKRRAPTLYVIIAIKLIKGLLLLLLALGVYSLSDNNLPEEFRRLLEFLHIDPERKFFTVMAEKIKEITPAKVYWVAGGTAFYSLFSLVEGVGLMFRASWAGFMAIGESGFFIPIEIYELMHKFTLMVLIILAINIVIVWYLFANRHRLFRHHHHH